MRINKLDFKKETWDMIFMGVLGLLAMLIASAMMVLIEHLTGTCDIKPFFK